jgi:hypothetical protein
MSESYCRRMDDTPRGSLGEARCGSSEMVVGRRTTDIKAVEISNRKRAIGGPVRMDSVMSTKQIQTKAAISSEARPAMSARIAKLGQGVVVAGVLATVSVAAIPTTAFAGHSGNGAAIGLGILGGVLAGAAIAAAAPPVYAAPPSYYYYPQQGYYSQTPGYYYETPAYYGPTAYGYPPYNYQ